MTASLHLRGLLSAVAIFCASSTFAAESNDHDVLGAWKGTGDDVQWVLNFLPNGTYQLRLGDSPTGSRGEYVTRGGKFQLLEGNQKRDVMSGSYRLKDCNVLILTLPNGTARMNRRGTIPTGGCGKGKTAATATSGGVFGSVGKSTSGSSTPSQPVPDTAKTAATAKSGVQKTAQPSTAAAKTTTRQSAKAATAEGASAIKSGAAAFWDKAKGVSHTAVEAGGKAAKVVGTKAQQAGKAVSKTFKGTPEEVADEAAKAGKQGD